ncbi:hypothetical protein SELMODRAFT_407649 [Selaginella moellendorffii]|uniref:Uncharacterized protein n=1 Tax=Selaginella moellendorffii TaxID=88036 RepID=D8R6A4_SELML|nr:hypothetical protein SELMODRAFT_407649 [Selaginella moellendorffii]
MAKTQFRVKRFFVRESLSPRLHTMSLYSKMPSKRPLTSHGTCGIVNRPSDHNSAVQRLPGAQDFPQIDLKSILPFIRYTYTYIFFTSYSGRVIGKSKGLNVDLKSTGSDLVKFTGRESTISSMTIAFTRKISLLMLMQTMFASKKWSNTTTKPKLLADANNLWASQRLEQ